MRPEQTQDEIMAFYHWLDRTELGPLEKKFLEVFGHYHNVFQTRMGVLNHILLGNGTGVTWRKGQLCGMMEDGHGGRQLTPDYAREEWRWVHLPGKVPYFVEWAPLYNIPEDATVEARNLCQEFIYHVISRGKASRRAYRDFIGSLHWNYRSTNKAHFDQLVATDMKAYDDLQKHLATVCRAQGWSWMLP